MKRIERENVKKKKKIKFQNWFIQKLVYVFHAFFKVVKPQDKGKRLH